MRHNGLKCLSKMMAHNFSPYEDTVSFMWHKEQIWLFLPPYFKSILSSVAMSIVLPTLGVLSPFAPVIFIYLYTNNFMCNEGVTLHYEAVMRTEKKTSSGFKPGNF